MNWAGNHGSGLLHYFYFIKVFVQAQTAATLNIKSQLFYYRHAVRTGEDGVGDKLTIGHTIGDRTHVIEKKRDRDGRIRERQSFVNLGEGKTSFAIQSGCCLVYFIVLGFVLVQDSSKEVECMMC